MEFRILGRLEVVDDAGPVRLGGPKQRAVLAHLILNANRTVSAETLIDALWGENPPPAARSSLQSYLSHLRQALGHDRLEGSAGAYRLRIEDGELDADRFTAQVETARRLATADATEASAAFAGALAIWRGPVLDDLHGMPGLEPDIARLQELRAAAIEDRIDADLAAGRHAAVVAELEGLITRSPLRERLWGQLMIALYRSGRQADALGAFERARTILSDELGIDPSADLRRIHEQILQQDQAIDGAPPPVVAAPAAAASTNPFKGLRPFLEADASDFFGREATVGHLVSRLAQTEADARFLLIIGPSGSGKSSVVRAGLIPALRAGAAPGSDRWTILEVLPGSSPFAELRAALTKVGLPADDNAPAAEVLQRAAAALPDPDAGLLVFIDQFEELFTAVTDDAVRTSFLDMLVGSVTDPRGRVRVVATLRADFYDRPLAHGGFAPLVRARTEILLPLTTDELERAITGPAARAGVSVAPALVARLLADVAGQPGGLPLLQYALTELFDLRSGSTLDVDAYRQIGGASGALSRRADATFASLADDGREAARQVFLRLVTPGEGVEDTRRRVLRSELARIGHDPAVVEGVIEAFGRARLLSFDRDLATGEPTVEVAHEALIGRWRRLRSWVDEARDDLRLGRGLAAGAAEWVAAEHDPSFLLTGARLGQLETWAGTSTVTLGEQERAFLDASLARRDELLAAEAAQAERERELERRGVRRLRALVAVMTAAAVFAAGLTIFAVGQRERAQQQQRFAVARGLAAQSVANLDVDHDRSILLALAAVEQTRAVDGTALPEAEEALHRAVVNTRLLRRFPGLGGVVDWSPQDMIVTEGPEETGIVDIRDARSGDSIHRFKGHDVDLNAIAFSDDGALLATGGDDAAVRVWETRSGSMVHEFVVGEDAPATSTSFSPDGRFVAGVWPWEGALRIWDTKTGRMVSEGIELGELAGSTSFSADGRRVAVPAYGDGALIVDTRSGEVIRRLAFGIVDADWSPDGRLLALSTFQGEVGLFDARTYKRLSTFVAHQGEIAGADWSRDSRYLATSATDGLASVWQIGSVGAREVVTLPAQDQGGGVMVAFGPTGTRVVTGDQGITSARIWDVTEAGGAELAVFPATTNGLGTFPPVSGSLDVMPDGTVLTPGRSDLIEARDPRTGERRWSLGRKRDGPFHEGVFAVRVSPDGGRIITASERRGTEVWAPASRDPIATLPSRSIQDVAWSPSADTFAAVGENQIVIYDREGTRLDLVIRSGQQVQPVALGPGDGTVAVAELPTGRINPELGRVSVLDIDSGEVVRSFEVLSGALAIHPRGGLLAIAHAFGPAEIWALDGEEPIATLAGHSGSIFDIAFNADGTQIATASADGTIGLWDSRTGTRSITLRGHRGPVLEARFSRDGSILASVGEDGTARTWALDLEELMSIAQGKLTRGFTDEECRQYLERPTCPEEAEDPA